MEHVDRDLAQLVSIGWCTGTPLPEVLDGSTLVRVVAQHRNGYYVHDGQQEYAVQPAPQFLKRNSDPVMRPAVGDFVLLSASTPPLIETILPRRSELSRAAAGERYSRQLIATNVDYVFLLMGLDGDFNPRRVERYQLLIQGSGAQAILVLSKIDLCTTEQYAKARAALDAVVSPTMPIYAINAKDPLSIEPLLDYLRPGDSVVLVGSSGAGKSTLTNTLLGRERQTVAAVRECDSRGRHTTTHRSLLALPSGGCLIDTPGMRELKLTGEEDLSAGGFDDIEELAIHCRFGDCAHHTEPGCAVRNALETGVLSAERWQNYLKLRHELIAAADSLEAQLKRKANARIANKALNKKLVDKYGSR